MLVVANSDDEESYIVPMESIGLRLCVREDGHRGSARIQLVLAGARGLRDHQ